MVLNHEVSVRQKTFQSARFLVGTGADLPE